VTCLIAVFFCVVYIRIIEWDVECPAVVAGSYGGYLEDILSLNKAWLLALMCNIEKEV
jgi:hypothetical protein